MAQLRSALSADDVFKRLKLLYEVSGGRRQADLSLRDIQLLLEYKEENDRLRADYKKKQHDFEWLRQMARDVHTGKSTRSIHELHYFQI